MEANPWDEVDHGRMFGEMSLLMRLAAVSSTENGESIGLGLGTDAPHRQEQQPGQQAQSKPKETSHQRRARKLDEAFMRHLEAMDRADRRRRRRALADDEAERTDSVAEVLGAGFGDSDGNSSGNNSSSSLQGVVRDIAAITATCELLAEHADTISKALHFPLSAGVSTIPLGFDEQQRLTELNEAAQELYTIQSGGVWSPTPTPHPATQKPPAVRDEQRERDQELMNQLEDATQKALRWTERVHSAAEQIISSHEGLASYFRKVAQQQTEQLAGNTGGGKQDSWAHTRRRLPY